MISIRILQITKMIEYKIYIYLMYIAYISERANSLTCFEKTCRNCVVKAEDIQGQTVECSIENIVTPKWSDVSFKLEDHSKILTEEHKQSDTEFSCLLLVAKDNKSDSSLDIIKGCAIKKTVLHLCDNLNSALKLQGRENLNCVSCETANCNIITNNQSNGNGLKNDEKKIQEENPINKQMKNYFMKLNTSQHDASLKPENNITVTRNLNDSHSSSSSQAKKNSGLSVKPSFINNIIIVFLLPIIYKIMTHK